MIKDVWYIDAPTVGKVTFFSYDLTLEEHIRQYVAQNMKLNIKKPLSE